MLPVKASPPKALSRRALEYVRESKAANTRRAYAAAWREFEAFCGARGAASIPAAPSILVDYLVQLAARKQRVSTMRVKVSAISFAHGLAGHPDPAKHPAVRQVFAGIRRKVGQPARKKAPATLEDIAGMVGTLPAGLKGKRDRAMLLLGYSGAFRRSELVALDVEDLRFGRDALRVTLRRSKTDQEGEGQTKTIADERPDLRPVAALREWLRAGKVRSGPVFRPVDQWGHVRDRRVSDKAVALVVKAAAEASGLDPAQFAGHSLRSGFITEAAKNGAPEWAIQEQTGHKSVTVLRGYMQSAGRGARAAVRAAFGVE